MVCSTLNRCSVTRGNEPGIIPWVGVMLSTLYAKVLAAVSAVSYTSCFHHDLVPLCMVVKIHGQIHGQAKNDYIIKRHVSILCLCKSANIAGVYPYFLV